MDKKPGLGEGSLVPMGISTKALNLGCLFPMSQYVESEVNYGHMGQEEAMGGLMTGTGCISM